MTHRRVEIVATERLLAGSEALRLRLARDLERLAASSSPSRLPGASPLDRRALREHAAALEALRRRLCDLDRPASADGVIAVGRLIDDPGSPLYDRRRRTAVGASIASALRLLEPHA